MERKLERNMSKLSQPLLLASQQWLKEMDSTQVLFGNLVVVEWFVFLRITSNVKLQWTNQCSKGTNVPFCIFIIR